GFSRTEQAALAPLNPNPSSITIPLHRFPHILQHPLLIAFDQFIEQPQHGLDRFAPACGAIFRAEDSKSLRLIHFASVLDKVNDDRCVFFVESVESAIIPDPKFEYVFQVAY
ncbi:MAG: hypothetical protein Q7J80_08265, partial [Anaerolineales bacterium]|nr:hypothetical protein [Anaerolineales bacterium]